MPTRSSIEYLEPRRLYSTAQLAADIKVGPIGSDPQQITGMFVPGIGATAVFTWNGWLQRLNGTNVEYVGPAYPRPNGVQYLGRAAGYLYFSSTPNDAFAAPTLWRSDGTDAGTVRVTSTEGTFEYAYPKQFTAAGPSVYFTTSGPNSRAALWETAPNGEPLLLRITESEPANLTELSGNANATLLFTVKHANGQQWLYRSQGTVASTQAVKQLDNGGFITDPPTSFTVLNGKAYFVARSGNGAMRVLWESDGTPVGTKVVAGQGFFDVSGVVAVGSTLYLSAQTQANGWGIWQQTPGGGGSFSLIQATRSAPDQLRAFKGQILYRAIFDNVGSGHAQLALGTQRLTAYDTALGSSSQNLLVANETRLFFTKTTAALGTELWESDGTTAGTQLVRDINPGPASSNPASAAFVGDEVYFAADDGTHGRELWRVEAAPFAELSARILTITGTASSDRIAVTIKSGQVRAYLKGQMLSFPATNVSGVLIDAGDGNDRVDASTFTRSVTVLGGTGNDSVVGGLANDSIVGGAGKDLLYGGAGNDWVHGNGGIDQLYGEHGDDFLYGGDHNDLLDGGTGVDRIFGGKGNDTLLGGLGNDRLYGENGDDILNGHSGRDYLDGGLGRDTARFDRYDTRVVIDVLV